MKTHAQIELEQMALGTELSRQLAHDVSNFVYNLVLQIEIWEKSARGPHHDWQNIKQESKKMTALLREWGRFHSRCLVEEPAPVDLHEIIRLVAAERFPAQPQVMTPSILAGPLRISSCSLALRHLLLLVLEDAALPLQAAETGPPVTLQTEKNQVAAIVRVIGTVAAESAPEAHPSLLRSACLSLARRLDANLLYERNDTGVSEVRIELPL